MTEDQRKMGEYIIKGTIEMQQVIRDLLAYGDTVVAQLRVDIDANGASVTCTSEDVVLGDSAQINQVLQNLISNAIVHHTNDGSPIVTTMSRRLDGGLVEVTVADNGPGIDPRYHERIFELFNQLRGGASGSGIGLAIVQRIEERHAGTVEVDSDGVHGTEFRVTVRNSRRRFQQIPHPSTIL